MSILYPKNYSLGLPDAHAFPKVQYAKIVEIIDAVNKIIAGTITLTDVELGNGSVSAPSLTFASDLDTGIYRIGANNIGIGVAGAKVLDISATGLGVVGSILGSAGTVGAPAYSFSAQTDMGLYKISATQLGVSVGGVLKGGFNSVGIFTDTITEQTTGAGVSFAKVKNSLTTTAITAHAGGGQGSATALTGEINIVSTVGTAGDSVILPTPIVGMEITVINTGTKAADIFPASGHTINELSANTQVSLGPQQVLRFVATSTSSWKTLLGATATIAQGTNINTGVTLNARKGVVTTQSASTAHDASDAFTVTNSAVTATSTVRAWIMDYSGTFATNGLPTVVVDNITTGAFDIVIMNTAAVNALSGTFKIGFEVIN